MKSLAELAAIKEKMKGKVSLREGSNDMRIVVGMATCGIAAGARPVLNAFVDAVAQEGLGETVTVTQTGCIGLCQYEPIVEVIAADHEKVTYVHVKPDMVDRIMKEHIKGGKPVAEYTIGANQK